MLVALLLGTCVLIMLHREKRVTPWCAVSILSLFVAPAATVEVADEVDSCSAGRAQVVADELAGQCGRYVLVPASAEFEELVARLCSRHGCTEVRRVGGSHDNGADALGRPPDGRTMAGDTLANLTLTYTDSSESITIYNDSSGTTDLVVDSSGCYT